MAQIENSEVVRYVLDKLINISSRKTTEGHAVSTMYGLLKKLEEKYDFLKHVEIKDVRFIEMDEPISVMSDINGVKSINIGEALSDIIKTMNNALGKDAGHFFIKELRNNIEEEYYTSITEMGLDLSLLQLEHDVNRLEKNLRKQKYPF